MKHLGIGKVKGGISDKGGQMGEFGVLFPWQGGKINDLGFSHCMGFRFITTIRVLAFFS